MIAPGHTIKVLDHGFVRFIERMGSDSRIVEAARISYKSPSKGDDADKKLLRYLLKNKHTSPFEMCKVSFNVKMPIFIMRQWVRHRMQNLNEVSARYTELPNEFYIPNGWRMQGVTNKQGSVAPNTDLEWNPRVDDGVDMTLTATEALRNQCELCYGIYKSMISVGIAREMARMILPVNIYTEIYCCWDLNNLLKFFALRDDSHAQAEIQDYARAMKQITFALFPWTMEIYEEMRANG